MKRLLIILLLLGLAAWGQDGPQVGIPAGGKLVPSAPTAAEPGGVKSQSCPGTDKMVGIDSGGNIVCAADAGGGSVPAGSILIVISGACPAGFSEEASLNGRTLLGTLAANADVGTTGGSDTLTPAGTVSQPSFSGQQAMLAHSGTAAASHVFTPQGSNAATATTGNCATAVKVGTSSSTACSATAPNLTVPAETWTGQQATLAHTVTQPNDHVYTPQGTVSQPAFTGAPADNRSAFTRVLFCKKD